MTATILLLSVNGKEFVNLILVLFFFNCGKICIHKIYHFLSIQLLALSTFMLLCTHHNYPSPGTLDSSISQLYV